MSSQAFSAEAPRSSTGWNIGLWVLQVLLALAFGMAGIMKLTTPIADMAKNAEWVAQLPNLVHFIGISELAGALGMILPALTRILPKLTPAAGAGLLTVMVLAAAFHISRGEFLHLPPCCILGVMAAVVLWGRLRKAPILPR